MNDLTKKALRIPLWMLGGYLMSKSFGCVNSFSAEMVFSIGVLMIGLGFYL